ncbi:MAG TPA: S-methyl-5'-thioadenosine phosphorylase [Candidatus Omnitrophota bacterium]|nr:S-methyl-5'-thioadenosine phosphorylase [Candidatus Omnitrophota bacterium]
MAKVGIIGGSGLYQMDGVKALKEVSLKTPFGAPSGKFMVCEIGGVETVFLARHGKGHRFSPSEINYRANMFGMKKLGVEAIVSVSAVGSLKEHLKPLDFVLPDQFLDRTFKRATSFFTEGIVAHVAFADPTAPELREVLWKASRELGLTVHQGGTYVCMEGPQFSTKAESNLYRSWGMDIIGMTNATEAKLAREAEISYATLAAVTDYDCWHISEEPVTVEMVINTLSHNTAVAQNTLVRMVDLLSEDNGSEACECEDALKNAIMTNPAKINQETKARLHLLVDKYLG